MNKPWKYYAKWKEPNAKVHILYDYIYMECPEEANPLRQKVDWWFARSGAGSGVKKNKK